MIGALILALFVYTGICAVITGMGMLLFHLSTIMRPRAEMHPKRSRMLLKTATAVLSSGLIAALSPSMIMAIFS